MTLLENAEMPPTVVSHNDNADRIRYFKSWLTQMINRGSALPEDELISKVAVITPEIADYILQNYNKSNRALKPAKIKKFVSRMQAGRWRVTHQGMSFSRCGILNNGQNRLTAISRAGVPVKVYLTFGEERDVFSVLDADISVRGGADTAHILGYKNTTCLSAAARILNVILSDDLTANTLINNEDLEPLLKQHPRLEDATTIGQRVSRNLRGASTAAMTVGAYLVQRDASDLRRFDNFIDRMCDGDKLGKKDALFIFRDAIRERAIDSGIPLSTTKAVAQAAAFINAWNVWLTGRNTKLASIKWEIGDSFPIAE